jgi:uncharacterized membrane-anchored protein YitT (DUF2179 family)
MHPKIGFFLKLKEWTFSPLWNMGLLTIGAVIIAVAVKGIGLPHQFIAGGVSGISLILVYTTDIFSLTTWFLILNLPLFVIGFMFVSPRFVIYSLYGMLAISFFYGVIDLTLPIDDTFLAALSYGTLLGAGMGLGFRTLGSTGGTDILAVLLQQKYNIRIGQTIFVLTLAIFGAGFLFLDTDAVLYSLTAVFVASVVSEYFMGMFNQRKMALIITENPDPIAEAITQDLHRGSTFLYGKGAYTGREKRMLMTVINNYQLKRLEELVFNLDPHAFVIFENTFNVIGQGFSRRKIY